jgi:hypothetical protein
VNLKQIFFIAAVAYLRSHISARDSVTVAAAITTARSATGSCNYTSTQASITVTPYVLDHPDGVHLYSYSNRGWSQSQFWSRRDIGCATPYGRGRHYGESGQFVYKAILQLTCWIGNRAVNGERDDIVSYNGTKARDHQEDLASCPDPRGSARRPLSVRSSAPTVDEKLTTSALETAAGM